jgi:hypothetical protein
LSGRRPVTCAFSEFRFNHDHHGNGLHLHETGIEDSRRFDRRTGIERYLEGSAVDRSERQRVGLLQCRWRHGACRHSDHGQAHQFSVVLGAHDGSFRQRTDPLPARYKGQEGAAADAMLHSHLGVLGVTGFLMKNTSANPLDYVEGGSLNSRRVQMSEWLDGTNTDLSSFSARGGKMIVAIGTGDTLASPGSQMNYYQALVDKMGRASVDSFARLFVIPQVGQGLRGNNYSTDGGSYVCQ